MFANWFLDFSSASSIDLGSNFVFDISTLSPLDFLSFNSGATSVWRVTLSDFSGLNFASKDSNPSTNSGSLSGSIDFIFNASCHDLSIIFSRAEACNCVMPILWIKTCLGILPSLNPGILAERLIELIVSFTHVLHVSDGISNSNEILLWGRGVVLTINASLAMFFVVITMSRILIISHYVISLKVNFLIK